MTSFPAVASLGFVVLPVLARAIARGTPETMLAAALVALAWATLVVIAWARERDERDGAGYAVLAYAPETAWDLDAATVRAPLVGRPGAPAPARARRPVVPLWGGAVLLA